MHLHKQQNWSNRVILVFIIGAGGKSGMLCSYEAKKRAGVTGKVIGMGHSDRSTKRIKDLGFCDVAIQGSAAQALDTYKIIDEVTNGELADITINCVNIPNTEMGSIMAQRIMEPFTSSAWQLVSLLQH